MIVFISILLALIPQIPRKKLSYENKNYEKEIKSVQLYSNKQAYRSHLLPAVTQLGQPDLILEFDDLRNDINSYYAKIIHCQYDWTPSTLRDLDFMMDYNEFNVNDYAYSSNTYIPYVHYKFQLPRVKLPGNYLLIVYRDGKQADLILSQRFMVFDPRTSLTQDNLNSGSLTLRSSNQQLNFTINYRGLEILNPFETVHVIIRQNQRWDNAKYNVRPSFVREDKQRIEYRLFADDKYFSAGNEFRFVDFRSINFPGQNTDRIDKSSRPPHLWVQPDYSRKDEVYAQYPDINGQFNIENLDQGNPETASSYIDVTFTLKASKLAEGKVFVLGAFNQWIKNADSEMKYDEVNGAYYNTTLMKQGWYNYQYVVEDKQLPAHYFEGSHFETENLYEVFLYYRPFQPNTDLLIGYFPFSVNPR